MSSILFFLCWFLLADHPPTTPPITTPTAQPVTQTDVKLWTGPEMTGLYKTNPNEFLISKSIHQVFEDKTGRIWFATQDDGLCVFDEGNFHYFSIGDGLGGKTVRSIVQDAAGELWFATNGGVSSYDGNSFHTFTVDQGLPHNDVLTMKIDSKGRIWAGTSNGLAKFDKTGFTAVPIQETETMPASNNLPTPINTIYEDKKGLLWLGSNGAGPFVFDGRKLIRFIKPGC